MTSLPLAKQANEGLLAHEQQLGLFHRNAISSKRFVLDDGPIAEGIPGPKVNVIVGAASIRNVGSTNLARFDDAELRDGITLRGNLLACLEGFEMKCPGHLARGYGRRHP